MHPYRAFILLQANCYRYSMLKEVYGLGLMMRMTIMTMRC